MEKGSWIVPAMVLLVLLLMFSDANTEVDCSLSELRCELMCQLTELTRQCAKCRSRAPVRFGKRSGHQHHHYPPLLPPPPPLPLDIEGQPVIPYEEKLRICCGQLLEFLLKSAAVSRRK